MNILKGWFRKRRQLLQNTKTMFIFKIEALFKNENKHTFLLSSFCNVCFKARWEKKKIYLLNLHKLHTGNVLKMLIEVSLVFENQKYEEEKTEIFLQLFTYCPLSLSSAFFGRKSYTISLWKGSIVFSEFIWTSM